MWNYLMSILIFYVIINSSIKIAKIFLDSNGRLEKIRKFNEKNNGFSASTLIISCVPIFRIMVVISIYYLCFCNEKKFEKILKED